MKINPSIFLLVSLLMFINYSIFGQIDEKQKDKLVKFTGGLSIGSQIYQVYGIENRNDNELWNIHGSANINLYNRLSLPFSFTMGRYGFSGSYPIFKQVGISPTYKWAKVHLGWRSMRMSNYTLAGNTFLGVGLELNPGLFRFAVMKGRFQKAIINKGLDQVGVNIPNYERAGYSVKLGVGTDKSFFDIIYFKGQDDPNSLNTIVTDSFGIFPAENVVLGFNSEWKINQSIYVFAEGATSVFTRDIHSDQLLDQRLSFLKNVLQPRTSTRFNYAYNTGINFGQSQWHFKLKYERVMPEFESMGSYYIRDDSERISIAPSFSLLQHKLRINGMIGLQKNNLLNVKKETTKNVIARGSFSYQKNEVFGINMNFNTFNLRQENGNAIINDTFRIAQINSSYSLTPYWTWMKDTTLAQNVTLSLNYQKLNDRSPFTREFTNMSTWFVNSYYNRTILKTGLSINIGANYNYILLPNLISTRYGGTVGINKQSKNTRWNVTFSSSVNASLINEKRDGNVISNNVNLNYNLSKKAVISFNSSLLFNNSKLYDNYKEIMTNLNLSYSF